MQNLENLLETIPRPLAERVRVLNDAPVQPAGYVLYWMRTAVRVEENPALDVAVAAANRLKLPLLVYHGLSERYPYASDRHHTFILQGARDVQRQFADSKISYALHVERPGHRGRHLRQLATSASLVVSEEMPVEPLRSWSLALCRGLKCGFLAVDTACVAPMRLFGKSYERAFAFRKAAKQHYDKRVGAEPIEIAPAHRFRTEPQLPFEPVDLQKRQVSDLISECEIDHSIGAVPHTVGGSIAGDKRWNDFKADGLKFYHRRRNDPLVAGVSRLSPYLHYGMVSPQRIAREAAAEGSQGAEKFLDELLVWRELAYVFCFYRPDHWRVSELPDWARETLAEHQSDPREILSWERMARGQTGDALWDAAQKSLLIHGELHNNVRMTWGKAILNWTSDAKSALARIIDLNHRYALDGRDPASFGGILWCLGQFDRPFSPPRPVLGTVRDRSTEQHAKRIDIKGYQRKVTRPWFDNMPKIAVIGAGISGLMCARTLADHRFDVTVFEKSRGVGGRMSNRRVDDELHFDHGAQYFTVRDPRFRRYLDSWIDDGIVKKWIAPIVTLENGTIKEKKSGTDRYVATPGMNAIAKHLASGLDIRLETQIAPLSRADEKWQLKSDDGSELGDFDFVVVAIPAAQAEELLVESERLAERAQSVKMSGCWAVMASFQQPLNVDFDAAFVHESPLSWVARNSSKPGRNAARDAWVLHGSPEWSSDHIDTPAAEVGKILSDAFWKAIGKAAKSPTYLTAHRWRHSLPTEPLSDQCLIDPSMMVAACGDWCGGPRVEGAFLSGMSVAGRVMAITQTDQLPEGPENHQLELF